MIEIAYDISLFYRKISCLCSYFKVIVMIKIKPQDVVCLLCTRFYFLTKNKIKNIIFKNLNFLK